MCDIRLKDQRILGYEKYGDPNGIPLLFFHGTPGSRFFCPSAKIAEKVGINLICVERPGYGLSTFQPRRKIIDFPKDIVQLADFLHLNNFAVAGHSGGGPYAQACAFVLPERVTTAAVISGAGPLKTPDATKGMNSMNRLGLIIGRYTPWFLWQALVFLFYHNRAQDPDADIDQHTRERPQADEEQIRRPEVREACVRSEIEAFRQGLRGMAWDARLMTRPWGFQMEELRIPVLLWHGTADNSTPISMGKYVASRLPVCKHYYYEGEAHLLIFPHWEDILTEVLKVHGAANKIKR